ncbi:hypothetical protein L3X14_06045 [Pseudomonas balearica]|uniref:hypothetical protein n=1 Tax=Stutzerimonas balearica TaxID=74829 RepID=UPI001F206C34|nr:hypothetical protein [Stutzerimonas balearica]MCF6756152.1 hypothetical protein [Stutzerimonas balearica]
MNSQAMQPTCVGTVYARIDDAAAAARDPFFAAWKKGAELIGGEAFPFAQGGINTWADAQLGALPALLKTLNSLDLPRRALLLTMVSLERPEQVHWITRELGMHYGHLTARQMGDEVFAATFDLLRTHH